MKKSNESATITIAEATKSPVNQITIFAGETSTGKPCLAVLTDLRLSPEDFKDLMLNIQIAGGYGFLKFYPEHKTKLISATKVDRETFTSLVKAYNWIKAEPKKPTKAINKKTVKTIKPTKGETLAIDPDYAAFLAWKEQMKK